MDRVSVNIASIPSRVDLVVETIHSVIDQCDRINLMLNGYKVNPYPHPKVNAIYLNNEKGDAAKFFCCNSEDGYMLFLDDDLTVTETYVADMIKAIDEYGIVTHHGRTFLGFPINSYYKDPCLKFRCLSENKDLRIVQFAGTGCLGFHTDTIRPQLSWFKRKNLADIWFSINCDRLKLPIYVLPHESDYFGYLNPESTIWDTEVKDDSFQTRAVNEYFEGKDIVL